MARFYPKTFETDSRPKSEDKVFNIIKNSFPDTWVVFLSFDYVNRSDNGIDQDGEVDFILYNPKHGILVLEVKGGAIRHCDGVWYSGAHVIHPYKQASKNKHAIRALFSKDTDEFPRISISHAVCFPDVKDRIPQLPAEANGITLTAADFNDFENKCIEIMSARPVFSNADVPHISYDEVMQTLLPNFDFAYSLREEIERDRKIFIKLSNLQYDAFRSLKNFKRLNIRGCAGSGKTVIAVKLAQELAQEGKNVLVLCFNKILANRLQNMVGAYHNIRAEAFFEFCVEIAKVPREDVQKFANNPKTWTHGLPILAQKAIQSQGIAYDAVIVDEGQDFSAQAWETIKMLPYEDGVFHIFYDDDQTLS